MKEELYFFDKKEFAFHFIKRREHQGTTSRRRDGSTYTQSSSPSDNRVKSAPNFICKDERLRPAWPPAKRGEASRHGGIKLQRPLSLNWRKYHAYVVPLLTPH
jgi:hypothetical protein